MSRSMRIILALVLVTSVAWIVWPDPRRSAAEEPMDLQSFLNGLTASIATAPHPVSGDSVPDVEMATLLPYHEEWGPTLRLHDFVGRTPLVVNVWASWCPPCRREALLLEAAWQEHRDQVRFIGINHRDQEDAALAFVEEFGLTFPSGADPRGDVANAFGLLGVPTTYFIDEAGRIDSTKVGEIGEETLESRIQALLPAQAP